MSRTPSSGLPCPPPRLAADLQQVRAFGGNFVRGSRNHPSVVIWGFLNECGSNTEAWRAVVEKSVRQVRALDPTRLVSFASMFATSDLCFDLVDLISITTYPGWYGCEDHPDPLSLIEPRIDLILEHLKKTGQAEKPMILSEIGAAESLNAVEKAA